MLRLGTTSSHPKCKMCIMAKQVLGIHDISFHPENTACPQKNIDAMAKLVKPTKTVTDFTKSSQGKYVPLALPHGFDTSRHCSNCWRSGQANGKDGKLRGDSHTTHSSINCPHVIAKRDQHSGNSTYHPHYSHNAPSPRNTYGDTRHNTYYTDRDKHHKSEYRSGVQSSASSAVSSMRSQTTEHYDNRGRD
jgi:hypothetical protein